MDKTERERAHTQPKESSHSTEGALTQPEEGSLRQHGEGSDTAERELIHSKKRAFAQNGEG